MGYSHYFPHTEVTKEVWANIVVDCVKAWYVVDIPVTVEFTDKLIMVNGIDEDLHEDFVLNREGSNGFESCKTAQKPYDLLVCMCLLIYKNHSPETIELSSDGRDSDWKEATDMVNNCFEQLI